MILKPVGMFYKNKDFISKTLSGVNDVFRPIGELGPVIKQRDQEDTDFTQDFAFDFPENNRVNN